MIVKFFDLEDDSNPFNGLAISDHERLAALLDSLRTREPFVAELVGEGDCCLDIGIGEDVGSVLCEFQDRPCLLALAGPENRRKHGFEFMMGGQPSYVPAKFILPFEKVKEIAIYFQQTGGLSPAFRWERG